jgi:hypothetical protein
MRKQLDQNTALSQLFAQSQRLADQSVVGADVSGFDAQMIAIYVDSYTDGTTNFAVKESDDDSTYTDAPSEQVGSIPTIDSSDDTGWHLVPYTGSHPFVGLSTSTSGTTNGATWAAYVVKGEKARTTY